MHIDKQADSMLINMAIERHIFSLAGKYRTIMFSFKPGSQAYLRKIQLAKTMAINIPSNIFAKCWSKVLLG